MKRSIFKWNTILVFYVITIFYGCISDKEKDIFPCVGFEYSVPEFLMFKKYDFINKHVNEIDEFCIKGEEIPSMSIIYSNRFVSEGCNDFDGSGIGDVFLSIKYVKNYPYLVQRMKTREEDFKKRLVDNPKFSAINFLNKTDTLIQGYSDSANQKLYRMMVTTKLNNFLIFTEYTVFCDSDDIDFHKKTFIEFLHSCSTTNW